jgi:hypothetical protein
LASTTSLAFGAALRTASTAARSSALPILSFSIGRRAFGAGGLGHLAGEPMLIVKQVFTGSRR